MNDTELENGFKLTIENAKKLIEEANGLKIFERFSRAYTLYQLAIEEVGKCVILYRAILDFYLGTPIDKKYLDNIGFESHLKKTKESLIAELIAIESFERSKGIETDLRQKIVNEFKEVSEMNTLKNRSLYVDVIDDKFESPDSLFTKVMVDKIAIAAQFRLKAVEPFLQPLEKMKESAEGIAEIMDDPEKMKEIESQYVI